MDRLIEGYRRFRSEIWPGNHKSFETLAEEGQTPHTLVIACADSRVDPRQIFGAGPGEIFVSTNVAAMVPAYMPGGVAQGTCAVLEYAVRVLKVSRIAVLGHSQCGGVKALVAGVPPELREFVEPWMAIAADVRNTVPPADGAQQKHYETEVVKLTLANIGTYPWVAEAVEAGLLRLDGFHFDIATGSLSRLDGERLARID